MMKFFKRNNQSARFRSGVFRFGAVAVAVVFAGGCAMFRPVADQTRQYVFDPDAYEAHSTEETEASFLVAIDRIDVPRYLEAPGIAVREERHRIRHSFNHRWAEPVETGLGRLLQETLTQEGAIDHVFTRVAERADWILRIQLSRCEGVIDDEGPRGVFRGTWEIREGADASLVERGSMAVDDVEWDGEDHGMLVAGLSAAANRLAGEIAGELLRVAGDR